MYLFGGFDHWAPVADGIDPLPSKDDTLLAFDPPADDRIMSTPELVADGGSRSYLPYREILDAALPQRVLDIVKEIRSRRGLIC